MENQELQAEVVCWRNNFCGHWTGRGGHYTGATLARDCGNLNGWADGRASRRRSATTAQRVRRDQSCDRDQDGSNRSQRLDLYYGCDVARSVARRYGALGTCSWG